MSLRHARAAWVTDADGPFPMVRLMSTGIVLRGVYGPCVILRGTAHVNVLSNGSPEGLLP